MTTTTTNTPRTDEQIWTTEYHHELCDVVDMSFARQLETELRASQAKVERLLYTLKFLRDECPLGKRTFARVSDAINESYDYPSN
jgi:hypothetical protein